jgi:hypothetical protein
MNIEILRQREIEFFFHAESPSCVQLRYNDPWKRWALPFHFLDVEDMEQALQAAGLPLEIACLHEPRSFPVSNEQLDVLAYWQQAGVRGIF